MAASVNTAMNLQKKNVDNKERVVNKLACVPKK